MWASLSGKTFEILSLAYSATSVSIKEPHFQSTKSEMYTLFTVVFILRNSDNENGMKNGFTVFKVLNINNARVLDELAKKKINSIKLPFSILWTLNNHVYPSKRFIVAHTYAKYRIFSFNINYNLLCVMSMKQHKNVVEIDFINFQQCI